MCLNNGGCSGSIKLHPTTGGGSDLTIPVSFCPGSGSGCGSSGEVIVANPTSVTLNATANETVSYQVNLYTSSASSISFTVSPSTTWLSQSFVNSSSVSSSSPAALTVIANTNGFASSQSGRITLNPSNGGASTVIPVTVNIPGGPSVSEFVVGGSPHGIAFDGTNIWVGNGGVTKLRASDGAVLGGFPTSNGAFGVAFDGANIWVAASNGSNNITKLRASDGTTLGIFAVGFDPMGVAFDGANIWVANAVSNSVTKLRASDGALLGTFSVGHAPQNLLFDGLNIWVANGYDNTVTKLRASDGATLGTFPVGADPIAVAFDGANVWVTNIVDNSVTELNAADGSRVGTFAAGQRPFGIAFDGANIWVTNRVGATVTKIRAADGGIQGTFNVGGDPWGLVFDGANMWVSNFGNGTVDKIAGSATATTITLTASPNPATAGQTVTLTVSVTPATAVGTVTFYDGQNALGVSALSNGSATLATSTLSVGNHSLTSVYGGDNNSAASTSSVVNLFVSQTAFTTTTLTASPNPAAIGLPVTLTASVTPPSANGTVSFRDGGTQIGSGTLSNGIGTFSTSLLAVGSHSLTASYSGDAADGPSASAPVILVVNAPSFPVGTTPMAVAFDGENIWVVNKDSNNVTKLRASDGAPLGIFQVGSLPYGIGFDGSNMWVSNAGAGTVMKLRAGDGVLLGTFTVGGSPTGVAFDGTSIWVSNFYGYVSKLRVSDGAVLGTFGVGSNAFFIVFDGANIWVTNNTADTVSKLRASDGADLGTFQVGSNPVGLAFDGVNIWVANQSSSNITKLRASDGAVLGTFSLAAQPCYGVAFDGTNIWVGVGGGFPINKLRPSDGGLAGAYDTGPGCKSFAFDGVNMWVTNGYGLNTVAKIYVGGGPGLNLASSANPSTFGQTVILTAQQAPTGSPNATITFRDGGVPIGTATTNANRSATFSISTLAVGSHSLTVTTSGANGGALTSNTITQVVGKGASTTTLTSTPDPSPYGQPVTLMANVVPAGAAGTVTFLDGTTPFGAGTVNGNGSATLTTSTLAVGRHSLVATYGGNANFNGSSGISNETVTQVSSTISVSASPNPGVVGNPITITATVSTGATGGVTFSDGTIQLGTSIVTSVGAATLSTSNLAIGNHSLTGAYSGDSNYTGSTWQPFPETINRPTTRTTLTVNPTSATTGQTVTFTATVTASPGASGNVTFFDNGAALGTSNLSGEFAIFTSSTLASGTHSLSATYSGDSNNESSASSAVGLTVSQGTISTTTILTASPNPATFGQTVTLIATVTPSNSAGTVNFGDGSAQIGAGILSNGIATFSTSALTVGSHTLTATYGGDNSRGTSSGIVGEVINQTVNATTTSLSAAPNPVSAGQTVTLNVAVTPSNASGTITVKDGSAAIGFATLNSGIATFTTSAMGPGSHPLTAIYSGDAANSPSTSATVLLVVNLAGVDSTPPRLTAFSFSPASVNTASSEVIVTVNFSATDDVSGVDAVAVTFFNPLKTVWWGATASFNGQLQVSGSVSITLPQFSAGGVWTPTVELVDKTGNVKLMSAPDVAALGFPTQLSVLPAPAGTCVQPLCVNRIDDSATTPVTGMLRYAALNAPNSATITFDSALNGQTIAIDTGSANNHIRINQDITIQGPGSGLLTISGADSTRIFFIAGGAFTISGLTLANGFAKGGNGSGGAAGMGGAIFINGGSVNLRDVGM